MADYQSFRVSLVRDGDPPTKTFTGPSDVWQHLQSEFETLDREHFVVIALDARSRPIGQNTVSIGTVSASIVHPREVFKYAILANASAIMFAHNHPSGDNSPSSDDLKLTRRLCQGGEIFGIEVLDHHIWGDQDGWRSLRKEGQMPIL